MSVADLAHGRNKQTGKEYTKRDVVVIDQTGQITVTLWYQMVVIKLTRQMSFIATMSSSRQKRFPRQRFDR